MNTKKVLSLCLVFVMAIAFFGCGKTEGPAASAPAETTDIVSVIGDIPTTQNFKDETVDADDMKAILTAGINAPSAMNKQPWHFSAITNKDVLNQISGDMGSGMPPAGAGPMPAGPMPSGDKPDMPAPPAGGSSTPKAGLADAPLVIVVSCKDGSEFDAGLASEAMCGMANALGYGTKIMTSTTMALNGANKEEYKKLLGIPGDQTAVAVIMVGHSAEEDAVTSATERNAYEEVVSVIE